MKRLAPLIVMLAVIISCCLPPPGPSPIPLPTSDRSIPVDLNIEQAVGFAAISDLLISGLPAEIIQKAKKEYVTADATLTSALNHAGYTVLVSDGLVNMVVGEGNARLCIMPYPGNMLSAMNPQSDSPVPFLGHQHGQAVYGVSNPPAGLDAKDKPEVTVVETVPLDGLSPDLRCVLARVNDANPYFAPGLLHVLLINISNREVAGFMPATFSPDSKIMLRWNSPLARPELVALDASGKYAKQMFNLKGCYYPPTPTARPTQLARLTVTPTPTKALPTIVGTPPPLTKEGKFDFLADLSKWPRIASQDDLTRYVEYIKNNLSQPWIKSVCDFPMGPFDQGDRKQLIYYDYPVCFCSQVLPIKKIAGFVIEKTGFSAMYGIISQVWTPSGSRFYTAIADLNGGGLANPEKRLTFTNGESYMSVFGDYLRDFRG